MMEKNAPVLSKKFREYLSTHLNLMLNLYEMTYGRRSNEEWYTPIRKKKRMQRRFVGYLTRFAERIRKENLNDSQ
jgi:hypothetical protein